MTRNASIVSGGSAGLEELRLAVQCVVGADTRVFLLECSELVDSTPRSYNVH